MEINKNSERLAAYIHHFKMETKRCDFNNNTAIINIFLKDLRDANNIAGKVYEKDPKTLSEVIRSVENLNTAQEVTATLSPHTVNMMSNDENYFICGKKGHISCPEAQCYNCSDFGHLLKTVMINSPIRDTSSSPQVSLPLT